MKGSSHLKTAVVSALVGAITATGTVALAGTGIGGIFNLGQPNTVNATSSLSGASTGAQLQVANTGTGTGAQGIAASNNSAAATLYGRNSGTGPAISGRADKKNNGVEGVSAGSGASGVYGANTSTNGFGVAGRSTGAAGIGVYGNNTGGGLGVLGKSTGSNGVHGSSGNTSASGVYGENTSTGGYGIAGRAGSDGYAVFGDNTGAGWAGWFTGKTHISGALDLGGAINCSGCVTAGNISGKVSDSDQLDGIDSTGFVQGYGKAEGRLNSVSQGTSEYLGGTIAGFLRLSYDCPNPPTGNNGTLHLYNDSGGVANVFVDSGGANPSFYYMPATGAGHEITFPAAATGDSFHIQAQAPFLGILTIEVATFHHVYVCHAEAQALLTGYS